MLDKISYFALKTSYFEIVQKTDSNPLLDDPYHQQIPVSGGWRESTKFHGRNQIVNVYGRRVSASDGGPKYVLRSKQERQINLCGRIYRVVTALILVLYSLGLACISKSVRRLLTEGKQKIRFAVPLCNIDRSNDSPKMLRQYRQMRARKRQIQSMQRRSLLAAPQALIKDVAYKASKSRLQEGIEVSEEAVEEIKNRFQEILKGEEASAGIHFYCSNDRVFTLDNVPGLVFKTQRYSHLNGKSMKSRYQKMISAQKIVDEHHLDLLVIPKAKKFKVEVDGKEYEIIAEQKLDVMQNRPLQEQYFEEHAHQLGEAMRQLAIFICKTGYSDVEWRNNPIVNNSFDAQGNQKVALVDTEHQDDVIEGLYGVDRSGLIGLVNEEQAQMIEAVAKEYGVNSPIDFEDAFHERKQLLSMGVAFKAYHARKGIVRGNEEIGCDITGLGFDVAEKGTARDRKQVTLGDVAQAIVDEINRLIVKNNQEEGTVQSKRTILLDTNEEQLFKYTRLGYPARSLDDSPLTSEEKKYRWFDRVLQALMDQGHIFKFEEEDRLGYRILA